MYKQFRDPYNLTLSSVQKLELVQLCTQRNVQISNHTALDAIKDQIMIYMKEDLKTNPDWALMQGTSCYEFAEWVLERKNLQQKLILISMPKEKPCPTPIVDNIMVTLNDIYHAGVEIPSGYEAKFGKMEELFKEGFTHFIGTTDFSKMETAKSILPIDRYTPTTHLFRVFLKKWKG